jgi:hypothetical protein
MHPACIPFKLCVFASKCLYLFWVFLNKPLVNQHKIHVQVIYSQVTGFSGVTKRVTLLLISSTHWNLTMINIRNTLILAILTSVLATSAMAANVMTAFRQGSVNMSLVGGNGYAFNESYYIIGVGASYYVVDGLSIRLDAETWRGGDPGIDKVSPSIQYVFYQVPRLLPYLGAYYRRTYIDELPDLDSTGGRAGVYIPAGNNVYIGLGGVYETYLDCEETVFISCSDTYPEFSVTVAF